MMIAAAVSAAAAVAAGALVFFSIRIKYLLSVQRRLPSSRAPSSWRSSCRHRNLPRHQLAGADTLANPFYLLWRASWAFAATGFLILSLVLDWGVRPASFGLARRLGATRPLLLHFGLALGNGHNLMLFGGR